MICEKKNFVTKIKILISIWYFILVGFLSRISIIFLFESSKISNFNTNLRNKNKLKKMLKILIFKPYVDFAIN